MSDLNEIGKALAAAQTEMSNVGFDSENPHFENKFASLAAVRDAVIPVFARHGVSLMQNLTTTDAGGVACETILLHASGQMLRLGPLVVPAMKKDAQGFGSAATYARRYSLMAVAGVAGVNEDDDANAATNQPAPARQLEKPLHPKVATALEALRTALALDADEPAVADAVQAWNQKASKDDRFYRAVWDAMTHDEQKAVQKLTGMAFSERQKKQMLANGRAA